MKLFLFTGAGHFDEVIYLFNSTAIEKLNIKTIERGTRNYKLMEQMTELWYNFAKYGLVYFHTLLNIFLFIRF